MIYEDFEWPPVFSVNGDMNMLQDRSAVNQKLEFQVRTRTNEVFLCDDGSDVPKDVFEPNDKAGAVLVQDDLKRVVSKKVPEAQFVSSKVSYNETEVDENEPNHFQRVSMTYRLKVTGTVDIFETKFQE